MDIEGYAVAHNLPDLEKMPLRKLVSFLWWYFTRNAARPEDVARFKNRLWLPPKGAVIPPESPWSAENETASFAAFAKQATGQDIGKQI